MKLKRLTQASIALASVALLHACGSDPSNEGLDDDGLRDDFYYPGQDQASSTAWDDLAAFLSMGANKAEDADALTAELSEAPSLYSSTTSENYASFATAVGPKLAKGAIQSQCASVEGFSEGMTAYFTNVDSTTGESTDVPLITSVAGAEVKYYFMKYKLTDPTTGQAEDNARVGIVVAPSAAGSYPLVMYGHGGTSGLAYGEIASLFGALQTKAIIAAPAFPGEAVFCTANETTGEDCSDYTNSIVHAPSVTQSGSHIFDEDVVEYQGLYNCLATALATVATPPFSGTIPKLDKTLASANATYSISDFPIFNTSNFSDFNGMKLVDMDLASAATSTDVNAPYTLFIGADRGGFVAQLAAGRSGWTALDLTYVTDGDDATTSAISTVATALSYNYSSMVYPTPIGVMALGANASMTMGLNRVALQYMILGILGDTPLKDLPGFSLLGDLFSNYGSGAEGWTVASTAAEVAVRDLAFLGGFVPLAVRDWTETDETSTTSARGEMLWLHGISDVAVGYSQAQIADGIMSTVSTYYTSIYNNGTDLPAAAKIPGLLNTTFAFQAADSYYDDEGEFNSDTDADGTADDFNHVADASFLTGNLVGLADEHAAIIAADGSDANADATIETFASAIASGSSGALSKTDTRATYYSLYNRKATSAYDGTKVAEDDRTAVTPAAVAASWLSLHYGKATSASFSSDIDKTE